MNLNRTAIKGLVATVATAALAVGVAGPAAVVSRADTGWDKKSVRVSDTGWDKKRIIADTGWDKKRIIAKRIIG